MKKERVANCLKMGASAHQRDSIAMATDCSAKIDKVI